MRCALLFLPAALAISALVDAQLLTGPAPSDPRIQTIVHDPNQVIALQVAPGFQLTLEFGPDERVESVAVGDSAAWTVTPNKRGDYLFVKVAPGAANTNMTVITDARRYVFDLVAASASSPQLLYAIRFRSSEPKLAALTPPEPVIVGRYHLGGAKSVRPAAIHDDGAKTYLSWPDSQPIPAIFAIDRTGREQLLSGTIRDGLYVVDSVADHLVFRFNKQMATATRQLPRPKR